MDSRKQIKRGALLSYVAIVFSIMVALLYTPWMVRNIGQTNYGLYTLATSLISIFMMDFGISAAVSRLLSKYRAENNYQAMRVVLGASLILYAVLDLIILILIVVVYFNLESIYAQLTPEELSTFRILFIIVALFDLISFPAVTQNGVLTSFERFTELKLCDLARRILIVVFVIIALSQNCGVIAVVLANVVAGLITIVLKGIIIHRIGFTPCFKGLKRSVFISILSFSIWVAVIVFARRLMYNMAPSVLGMVSGSIAISIFAPASALCGFYYAISEAINGLFLPRVSQMVADNNDEGISALMIKVGRFQFFLLGWVLVAFIGVGKDFIIQWMGEEYALSYYCAILLFIPAMLEYSQDVGYTAVVAKNKVKFQAIGLSIISVVALGISFLFGYLWGAIGIGVSIFLAGLFNVALQGYIFSTKLNISMKQYYRQSALPMVLPYIGTLLFSLFINRISPLPSGWFRVVIHAAVISLFYLIMCKIILYRNYTIKEIIKSFTR